MTKLVKCRECLKFFRTDSKRRMMCDKHVIKPNQSLTGIAWTGMKDHIKQCQKSKERMNE